jgi:hypothetical protein
VEISKALESVPELRPARARRLPDLGPPLGPAAGKRHFDPLAGGQCRGGAGGSGQDGRGSGLLSRDIVAIDMRLADRVTVRLSDEAAEERKIMTGGKGASGRRERDT